MSAYASTHMLFRSLNKVEVQKFYDYARNNPPPQVDDWTITHPICRATWRRLKTVDAGYPLLSEEMQASEVLAEDK
jgi:hypothetical protein